MTENSVLVSGICFCKDWINCGETNYEIQTWVEKLQDTNEVYCYVSPYW